MIGRVGRRRSLAAILSLPLLASACSTSPSPSQSTVPSERPTFSAMPSPTATPDPTPADLSARRMVWFAPLPTWTAGPGRAFRGSDDFMALFADDAEWTQAAERIDVFKLYGEWVDTATLTELRTAIDGIRTRGMILAVEAGPLDAMGCGAGIEGFAGSGSGRRLAQRIKEAGGTLQVIALDEPWFYAHVYDGANAFHWPVERVAEGVAAFVAAVRQEFPWVVIGDIEPTPTPVSAEGLAEWMDAYHAAVGQPMAFMHLDSSWFRTSVGFGVPDWSALAVQVETAGAARGIPVGMIYNGGDAPSDEQWLHLAGQHALDHEDRDGGRPDHTIFQSWNPKPDRVLPETDPDTFTALVNRYFDDRASLGLGVAYQRPVTASSASPYSPVESAVDGNPNTAWNAGGGPPAWIEVDLGQAISLSEIRLTVAQYPPGVSEHLVWGRVAEGTELVLLGTLSGETANYDILRLTSDGTWPAVRWLRVETSVSTQWPAWYEIEAWGE